MRSPSVKLENENLSMRNPVRTDNEMMHIYQDIFCRQAVESLTDLM